QRESRRVLRRTRRKIHWRSIEGELAGPESSRWYDGLVRKRGDESASIIVGEPERLVLDDRSTDRSTEYIANKRILRLHIPCRVVNIVIEEVPRRLCVIAAKPIRVPMQVVRPALRDHFDDRTGVAPVFRQIVVRDHSELLRRIRVQR